MMGVFSRESMGGIVGTSGIVELGEFMMGLGSVEDVKMNVVFVWEAWAAGMRFNTRSSKEVFEKYFLLKLLLKIHWDKEIPLNKLCFLDNPICDLLDFVCKKHSSEVLLTLYRFSSLKMANETIVGNDIEYIDLQSYELEKIFSQSIAFLKEIVLLKDSEPLLLYLLEQIHECLKCHTPKWQNIDYIPEVESLSEQVIALLLYIIDPQLRIFDAKNACKVVRDIKEPFSLAEFEKVVSLDRLNRWLVSYNRKEAFMIQMHREKRLCTIEEVNKVLEEENLSPFGAGIFSILKKIAMLEFNVAPILQEALNEIYQKSHLED